MQTGRTDALRFEGIPIRSASVVEILRVIAIPAGPHIAPLRTPLTKRAANPRYLDVASVIDGGPLGVQRLVVRDAK